MDPGYRRGWDVEEPWQAVHRGDMRAEQHAGQETAAWGELWQATPREWFMWTLEVAQTDLSTYTPQQRGTLQRGVLSLFWTAYGPGLGGDPDDLELPSDSELHRFNWRFNGSSRRSSIFRQPLKRPFMPHGLPSGPAGTGRCRRNGRLSNSANIAFCGSLTIYGRCGLSATTSTH